MSIFYTYEKSMEEEKRVFLRHLYHDKRGGQMIRLRISGKEVSQLSTCDMEQLAATGTDSANFYTTVNTFRGYKRESSRVFNYTAIFIDLDCNSHDMEKIRDAKDRTVRILEAAYESGELSVPTMITDTGRGFGLQYILKKSIANTNRTVDQKAFFKKVRKKLFEKYQEILSVDSQAAQADAAVLDDARVCRMPGTYNAAADRYCRLISISEKYYELNEIVKGCHLWIWKSDEAYKKEREERERKRKAQIASGAVVSFAEYKFPFLDARLEQLMKLQDLRGKDCTNDCRENILFIAYSTLTQIDHDTAAARLQEMNDRFVEPLAQDELDHIVEETDNSVGVGHRGYYKLKNEYIIERLDLTEEEIRVIGLGSGWKRTAERHAARQAKIEVRKKVIELLQQADHLTYDQIAEVSGVSRRKVCTIAKEEGLMRYGKVAERYQKQKEKKEKEAEVIRLESARNHSVHSVESAKIATKSVCVSFEGLSGFSLLSTSSFGTCARQRLRVANSDAVAAVPLLETVAVLPTLVGYASNVLGRSLLRLYNKCMLIDSIKDAALMRLKESLPMYDVKNLTAFYKALSEDGTFLARLLVSIPAPSGWSATETSSERQSRLDFYLSLYKDERFDLITSTPEYLYRLNYAVLKQVKMTFMQVKRLHRKYVYVEKRQIAATDIQECFNSLTYKDIVILCERIAHQGKLQTVKKPFFYIIGCVYKYKHPDLAEEQAERIEQEKDSVENGFCNFTQRDINFDLIQANAVRELIGEPLLTEEEYVELMKLGAV